MAETAEETLRRLEAEVGAVGQRQDQQAAIEAESPDHTLARLQASVRADQERGQLGWASFRDPAYFWRNVASTIGLLGTPIIDPLTRPAPGTPAREALEGLGTFERLDEATGRSRDAAIGVMRRIGELTGVGNIPADLPERPDTILGHIYQSLPGAAVFGAGTVAAAPRIAAATAGARSPAGQAFSEVAAELAARPATTLRSVMTAEPGMVATRELARPYVEQVFDPNSPSFASQAARSAILFSLETLGAFPTERLGRLIPVPRAERILPRQPAGEPILRDVVEPNEAGQIARIRAVNFNDTIDRLIARVLERVADPNLGEIQAGRNLRGGLVAARNYAKAEEQRAWGEVDSSIVGKPRGFIEAMEDQLAEAAAKPGVADNYPVALLRAIRSQLVDKGIYIPGTAGTPTTVRPIGPTGAPTGSWQPGQGVPPLTAARVQLTPGTPGTPGRIVPSWKDTPVKDLQEIRSRLMTASDEAAETGVLQVRPNLVLRDNINRLVDELTNSIEAVGQNIDPRFMPAYEYARNTSRAYHERFRRGPVGDLLMVTRQTPFADDLSDIPVGGFRQPVQTLARQLLDADETATHVLQAGTPFQRQIANPAMGEAAQAGVRQTADEAIRTMFQRDVLGHFESLQSVTPPNRALEGLSTAYSGSPAPVRSAVLRAREWLREKGPLIEGFVQTTAQLGQTVARLGRLLEARNNHTQSVLSQFVGRNAKEVFEESLRSPNVRDRFELMERTFRNNPTFMEGAQRAIIDMVFAGRGADPNVALQRMTQGNYRDALVALFKGDPDKLDRLYRMTQQARDTLGPTVASTQAGGARVIPGEVRATEDFRTKATRFGATWAARIFGLSAGGFLARAIGLGSAGSLSVPMRLSRGAADYVAYQWLKNRVNTLDIVRDAVFDPGLEARIFNLAPGNYKDLKAELNLMLRYVRRFEAITNDDIDRYLSGSAQRTYWQERRAIREEAIRQRRDPFRRNQ